MPLTVGFTGHRPNRLRVGAEVIERRIGEVLRLVVADRSGSNIAVSALAEGSDRMFARAALGQGFALHALFPFKTGDYVTTFGDAHAMPEFERLLAKAKQVDVCPGSLDDDAAAYEVCGHYIVDRSDVLVTVWDGKLAAGRGGTTDILAYALAQSTPVVWVSAVEDRQARVLNGTTELAMSAAEPVGPVWIDSFST